MKIGIDCRAILNPERGEAGGVGHYVYQLVRHLLKIDNKNEYTLFFDQKIKKGKLKKFEQKNVKISFYPFFLYSKFVPTYLSHYLFDAMVQKEKFDVFHFPYIPEHPRKINAKIVLTIHDLSSFKLPSCYSSKECQNAKKEISFILPFADYVITVSQSTKKDLIDLFKFSPEKISVIYHGLDKRFLKEKTEKEIKEVKNKYGISSNYVFFLSPLENRKNVCRIIQAFDRVKEEIKETPAKFSSVLGKDDKIQLVLAGRPGSAERKIKEKINKSSYRDDIILANYVQPDDLGALFKGAKVFLFPSLYEGFGLPIIEAMSAKTPVITSKISSMPEIAGKGNALFVDPYRIENIANALTSLLSDSELRKKITKNYSQKVKEYSWDKTAQQTLDLYYKLAS